MTIKVSNYITIYEPTSEVKEWCKSNLVIDNPEYHKMEALGKYTGNVSRYIYLYEKDGDILRLPFGCISDICRMFPQKDAYKVEFGSFKPMNYQSNINLYPYQENAVNEAIKRKNGVLVMPCGAGKTQTALELIARIGGKCLWLTHTKDLLQQSMNRAKANLGISYDDYGTITEGKVNIGRMLTFATVQTMCKLDLSLFKHSFDVIVVDECHKAIGTPTRCMQFYKVLSAISCRYKFGITATPKRADGLQDCMFSLLGKVIYTVGREEVKNTTCEVVVKTYETGYMPEEEVILCGDGTIDYSKLVKALIKDRKRLKVVIDKINSLDGCMLVLGNRIEYLMDLQEQYKGKSICLSGMTNNKKNKEARKKALQQLNAGEIDCIFATYQLAKEGLDVPNLRYVVFATPEKDETTVIQSAGRVGRKADGKEYGTVIDFVDAFAMYRSWSKKRQNIYKKLEYEIL